MNINNSLANIGIKTILVILSLIYLLITTFIYTYLTDLNPVIYFNVIIWLVFCYILLYPAMILSNGNFISKTFISILISLISIYFIFGMKSSVFFTTVQSALIDESSMWLPKVDFNDLFSTLFSIDEYNDKLAFLLEFDILNLSYKGRGGFDTGSAFTNFFRIIECLGIIIIPVYYHFDTKDNNE